MSVFLGLPLSQVTRFGKKVSVDDDEKMKSLVTWLSCVVTHGAQMVTITESPTVHNDEQPETEDSRMDEPDGSGDKSPQN